MITLLYGQPGTGKSTLATGMALEYLSEGRRVVANFPIDAAPASVSPYGRLLNASIEVVPSRPAPEHLEAIGLGWRDKADVGREDRCGLLVIDEAGPWIDSRRWNDKHRAWLIDWMLHSRKRGWDLVLIAQAPALVDKQVREAVVECYARCRRTDRMKLPGTSISFPRMHVAIARYGLDPNAPRLRTWVYRGTLEQRCFASYALFDATGDGHGWYSTLPPRLTRWRDYKGPWRLLEAFRGGRPTAAPRKPIRKPRPPVVEFLTRFPPDVRVAEWQRLARLGAV